MPIDLTNSFDLTVSQLVLATEGNDSRFEAFCREAVSALEGGSPILSTSTSWDLGRDGVGAGGARGIYVCASLRDDVDTKALNDILRLASTTTRIRRVYFCSSHKLTEHRITQLETQLSEEIEDAFEINCLDSTKLIDAIATSPQIIERHYGAEIRSVLRTISRDPAEATELSGLRLALVASSGDDSVQIRRELYRAVLIEVLSDNTGRTLAVWAKHVSEHLRLGHSIAEAVLQPHVDELVTEGLVVRDGQVFRISIAGQEQKSSSTVDAAQRLIGGRLAIRVALEKSIGEKLGDDDFSRIWAIFEERIARHFHSRGMVLVAEVSALLSGSAEGSTTELKSQLSFLEELSNAIGSTASHPQRRKELVQAITDLFTDRTGPAAEWLVRVCASFVCCCALGLEHTSSAALGRLFSRTTLVLDSDVVLSLLGEGEPEHDSVLMIVSKWIRIGGKVLVAEPVLEEVAYHAHIAQRDFEQVAQLLPGSPEDRLHIVENAFVRSFAEVMARGEATARHWSRYINQYRGRNPYDWRPVFAQLSSEHSISKLPPKTSDLDDFELKVKAYLIQDAARRGYTGKTASDKATRDARLYAEMIHYLRRTRATDPNATSLLVSSAYRLARAESHFHEAAEREIVVPVSAILYMLSLLPQVSLGLSALKTFLFDERRPGFSSDLERTILRTVRASQEVSMPWAKRGLLIRELRDRLIEDARKQGKAVRTDGDAYQLEQEALAPANAARTMELLRESLDAIVVATRAEEEIAELKRQNEELRKQLQQAKARRS